MLQAFGSIENPLKIISPQNNYGDVDFMQGGLVMFITNLFRFFTLIAGLWALFNFIFAGFQYVTSQGDPKQLEEARNKIFMSVIGLVIIAGSFAFIAILSKIFFGDYGAVIRPVIYGPGSAQ